MFAKEFTHKNGLYTAMHNVKYVCINKQRRCKKSATKPVDSLDMEAHGL